MTIANAVIGFLNGHFWALWWLTVIIYVLRNAAYAALVREIRGRK